MRTRIAAIAALALLGLSAVACSDDDKINAELTKIFEDAGMTSDDAECVADYMVENKEGDAQDLADAINNGEDSAAELQQEAMADCGIGGGGEDVSEDESTDDSGDEEVTDDEGGEEEVEEEE